MAEKVIQEFKIIETDDGYRIEIKGDKEHLRKWMEGKHRRRGPWKWRGFGPFGFGMPGMYRRGHHGPWDFDVEIEEVDEDESSST